MFYALKLEAIGDNIRYERRMCHKHGVAWVPRRTIEYMLRTPYVARIVGVGRYGELIREFVRGRRDYTAANSVGSRGIWIHYLLGDGTYEVQDLLNWTKFRRYFLRVRNGAAQEVVRRSR